MPVVAFQYLTPKYLFNHVSYTNSINLDKQVVDIKRRSDWNIISLGSSEVRWGFDPDSFDEGMGTNLDLGDFEPVAFNFGIDGFSPGLIYSMMHGLDLKQLAPRLKMLLIGVNLAESNSISEPGYKPGVCGALQRPVLTSPFAIDRKLDDICIKPSWRDEFVGIANELVIFRYRKAIRNLVLQGGHTTGFIPMQSNGLPHMANGYQPHQSINESYANFISSWDRLVLEKKEHPDRFQPLDPQIWVNAVAEGGFFDAWNEYGKQNDILIAFYALPTSPMYFDVYDRRDDYKNNSELVRKWAEENNGVFVDLGIQDGFDRKHDYSDYRHLSQYGAPKFSFMLGADLARNLAATHNQWAIRGEKQVNCVGCFQ